MRRWLYCPYTSGREATTPNYLLRGHMHSDYLEDHRGCGIVKDQGAVDLFTFTFVGSHLER